MTLDNCTFVCRSATTDNVVQYKVVAHVWSPLELLASINLQDSRLILFQQNLTTANGSWGHSPVLIANYRYTGITGSLLCAAKTAALLYAHQLDTACPVC